MGLLRILLAFAVVAAHFPSSRLLSFVGGEIAVQSFFAISGFYMALISTKYASVKNFYISRYLRLFPVYFTVTLMTLMVLILDTAIISEFIALPNSAKIYLIFTNLTMFFQDAAMFMGVNNGNLVFMKNFLDSNPPLYKFLLVPQAWSIGLELSFYLICPFIMNRSVKFIMFVMAISILIRVVLINSYSYADPWSYRFFPTELALFMAGAISQKTFSMCRCKNEVYMLLFCFIVLFTFSFSYIPLDYQAKKIVYI